MSDALERDEREQVHDHRFIRVGILGGYGPDYVGAGVYEPGYTPTAKIVLRNSLFLNDRSLGVNVYHGKHVSFGGFARYTGGRSDNTRGSGDWATSAAP